MSTDWYLINPPYDQVSGFESEALEDYGVDGFAEMLDSGIACDVELCNYDLTNRIKTRSIVQNRTQDTKLNALWRQFFFPIGMSHAGMYVYYQKRYWLIENCVDNNGTCDKAIAIICNHKLSWINASGKIISRWASIMSASQYNNGQLKDRNYHYVLRTDQQMITMPNDDDCLLLNEESRFIIDRRCQVYEHNMKAKETNTKFPLITYILTRNDGVAYDYITEGIHEIMVTQDEQHENDGYYVVDGVGYWLCDIPLGNKSDVQKSCKIAADYYEVYCGLGETIFSPVFYDDNGETVSVTPHWEIKSDFEDSLMVTYDGDNISIGTNDIKIINHSFMLVLSGDGYDPVEQEIKITSLI